MGVESVDDLVGRAERVLRESGCEAEANIVHALLAALRDATSALCGRDAMMSRATFAAYLADGLRERR